MKNKKAILMPETLKIILAVLCIVLLIYLGVKMYEIFNRTHELQQARETLANILGKAEALEDGESAEYLIIGPKDWNLLIAEDFLEGVKEYSLCMCTKKDSADLKICKSNGICNSIDGSISMLGKFTICSSKGVYVPNCISTSLVPMPLYIQKTKGTIYLRYSQLVSSLLLKENELESRLNVFNDGSNEFALDFMNMLMPLDLGASSMDPNLLMQDNQIYAFYNSKENYISLLKNSASYSGARVLVGIIDSLGYVWFSRDLATSFESDSSSFNLGEYLTGFPDAETKEIKYLINTYGGEREYYTVLIKTSMKVDFEKLKEAITEELVSK